MALESLSVIAEIRDESSQAAALAELSTVYSRTNLEFGDAEKSIVDKLLYKVGW